ncbi:prolipoprotein diacylglyceryl transferase [candidate division KSB1 bacterium]|nr:prolipoprotein diacylglyceryl transferase [candidate division KSB1 bacterium]
MLPVLFEHGPIKVYSFGLMVLLAFILCYWLAVRGFQKAGIDRTNLHVIIAIIALSSFLGAKLFYVFETRRTLDLNVLQSLELKSGLVWYGGFFTAVIAAAFYINRWPKYRLLAIDILMPLVLLGYAVGRIGCFLAGDGDYGPPSNMPWAMAFPNGVVPVYTKVHPTPLYDSALSFSFFLIIQIRKGKWQAGSTAIVSLFLLGLTRFITEFYRNTEIWLWDWLTLAHIFSLLLMLSAVILYFTLKRKQNT